MYAGGYWPRPAPAIVSGMSVSDAMSSVQTGLAQGPLWQYCSVFGAYHCPGDLRVKRQVGDHWAYDSYSKTDGMNGGQWTISSIQKLGNVPEPSRAMTFIEEADSRNFNNGTWVLDVVSQTWGDTFAVFHNNSSTIGFADGHGESHKWLERNTLVQASAAQSGNDQVFGWKKNSPNDRDFAWAEPLYKYEKWPKYTRYY